MFLALAGPLECLEPGYNWHLTHDFHEKAEATDSGNFSGMAKNLKCLIEALPLGFQLNDRNPRCKGFYAGHFKIHKVWNLVT